MSHAPSAPREHKPHVLPVKVYAGVWIGLLILTVITVRVSYSDFGVLNLVVAMAVATVKATLVVLYFMHLKYDEKFNILIFAGCLAFLFTFFVLTLADTTERGKVDPLEARPLKFVPARPELEPGAAGDSLRHSAAPDSAAHAAPDSTAPATGDSTAPAAHPPGEEAPPEGDAPGH